MTIQPHINNNIQGFQILDDKGEYFLVEATEQLAIEKYNAIKIREANPPPPTYQELRKKEFDQKFGNGDAIESIRNQLDLIYKYIKNGDMSFVNMIDEVKTKIPKG